MTMSEGLNLHEFRYETMNRIMDTLGKCIDSSFDEAFDLAFSNIKEYVYVDLNKDDVNIEIKDNAIIHVNGEYSDEYTYVFSLIFVSILIAYYHNQTSTHLRIAL